MRLRIGILTMIVVAMMAVTGCARKTMLIVQTDPTGADVTEASLGLLGQTPLEKQFKKRDHRLDLTVSKKGYVSESAQVLLRKGKTFTLKKDLFERLSHIDITTEPDGVAVFVKFIDTPAYKNANCTARPTMINSAQQGEVIKRFLGNTPIRYQEDPEKPLGECDFLLFQKAGYKDNSALFRLKEKRLHTVMEPVAVKQR